ncbi:hypothetical protein [Bacillus sp. JJ722]|uniref:hypothetical protein n=1 Tax=Bacillus sp. JJ722 TaxID=3122973 RepID=UPI003000B32E
MYSNQVFQEQAVHDITEQLVYVNPNYIGTGKLKDKTEKIHLIRISVHFSIRQKQLFHSER